MRRVNMALGEIVGSSLCGGTYVEVIPAPDGEWTDAVEAIEFAHKAYRSGWEEAVKAYAVWSDGEQFVGVMQKPLRDVIAKGPAEDILQINLAELGVTSGEPDPVVARLVMVEAAIERIKDALFPLEDH